MRPLRVKEIAEQKASAPGQLALAWVMAQGNDVVPIPGTKRRRYLEENIAAADIELSDGELARIDEVAPLGATAGDGYDETGMTAVQG
ncbi:MAG TPA: aldo/keto reductase [Acidimicrobiales bacterium]|nr:aldo/keto reductase [Acidimicrobiales bacterium]